MAQTKIGAEITGAKLIGISVEEYRSQKARGAKWCTRCKKWKPAAEFRKDKSRGDGLASSCYFHGLSTGTGRGAPKGRPSAMKGKTFSPESSARMGRRPGFVSEKRGRPRTIEERMAISAALRKTAQRGSACHSYKDGRLSERRGQRFSLEYKRWRYDVFLRDNFTCRTCGDSRGGNLIAHHIKSFANYPELRFEASNGMTVCEDCHDAIHYR